MDPREQDLTNDFKDNVAYERLVVTTLTEAETAYHGQPGLIHDIRSFPRKIMSIGGYSAREEVIKEVAPRLRPLVFVASYKILDLFVELVLKLKSQTPPKSGWSFDDKKKLIAKGCYQLPAILSFTDGIWDRMAALYVNLLEARHCVVHRRSNQDSDGTLIIQDRSGNALTPLAPLEQDKFAELTYFLSESVIRQEISIRQRNVILNTLDYLNVHHGHLKTGVIVPAEIPKVIVNLIPLNESRWRLDLKSIRDHLAKCQPWAEAGDIEVYRPGETTATFFAELENLSGHDSLEFSDGELPCGVHTL